MKETPQRPHRLRRLSDEEIALWIEVARGVARRRGATLPTRSTPAAGEPAPAPPLAAAEGSGKPAGEVVPAPLLAPIERRLKREGLAPRRARRDRRRARPAWAHPTRGAPGAARLPAPFAGARRATGHRCHRQGRATGRAGRMAARARRAEAAHSALAARARPALGRARLRGGRTRPRRLGRALCAAEEASGASGFGVGYITR